VRNCPPRRRKRAWRIKGLPPRNAQTSVMAVTDRSPGLGETSNVNMVQRASTKAFLEPGDTRQQWKGEAAASFVCAGITSSRMLPTSSVGYWSPLLSCSYTSASEAKWSFGGDFMPEISSVNNQPALPQPQPSRRMLSQFSALPVTRPEPGDLGASRSALSAVYPGGAASIQSCVGADQS
jgi:hypothetical protein